MLRFFIAVLLYIGASASAVSAGLVSKFVPDTDKKLPFSAHATRNLKKVAINTATSTAANGGKVGKNALSAAAGAMVDAGAASVAQEIGRAYRNGSGDMSWLTHKVCHFVLGGGSAALRGEDPLSGAVGATIGEVVADAMIARALEQTRADVLEQLEDFRANYGTLPPVQDAELLTQITFQERLLYERERIEQVGRLAAAGTAFVGHMDISAADAAALNAIEHNAIPSIDVLIENQHRSLLDQLLAYEQATAKEEIIEYCVEQKVAASICEVFEPIVLFLCPGSDLIELGFDYYNGKTVTIAECILAGLSVTPVGKGCAVIQKGSKKVIAKTSLLKKVEISEELAEEALQHVGKVGTYKEMKKLTKGFRGEIQAHHLDAKKHASKKGISTNDGLATILTREQHKATRSYGSKAKTILEETNARSELAKDIMDVRRILKKDGLFTTQINQSLVHYIKTLIEKHPEVYKK